MRKKIVGVMGPGAGATEIDIKNAYALGTEIANNGWILLSGGRNIGTMDAACRGAHDAGGFVVGILPFKDDSDASIGVDVAIVTGMGGGRNVINVLSSDIVVVCGIGAGTVSEIGHALKVGKPTILLATGQKSEIFFKDIAPELIYLTKNVDETIMLIKELQKS